MKWIRGWLLLQVEGFEALRFINLCRMNDILLWNVRESSDDATFCVYFIEIRLKDLYRIRPLVRKTRVKVAIRRKCGLPFFMYGQRKNKGFFLGAFLFLFALFYSQTLVWGIYIDGNYKVTDNQLEKYLWEQGIHAGMAKDDILYNQIEADILKNFEEISWCSLKLENGSLYITVNENAVVELRSAKEGVNSGKNLAANVDGRIEELVVREGFPNAKMGDSVTKGDVLVVGRVPIYNEAGEIDHFNEVTPSAKIVISYDYFYKDSLGKQRICKEYTGRESYGIRWKGKTYFAKNYASYDMEQLYEWKVGGEYFTVVRYLEYQKKEYFLDEMMAENILREKLEYFLDSFIEKGVQIIANDVKIIGSIDSFQMEGVIRMQGEFDE